MKKALMLSDDPRSMSSYGMMVKQIMINTSEHYDWIHLNRNRIHGKPEDLGYCYTIPIANQRRKLIQSVIPSAIKEYDPAFFFTHGDPHNFWGFRYATKDLPYLHYFPLDCTQEEIFRKHRDIFEGWDVIIPQSKFGESFTRKFWGECEEAIYGYVNDYHQYRSQENKEMLKEFSKKLAIGDRKVLLYIGRLGWRKNVQFLIEGFRRLIQERDRRDVVLYLHSDFADPSADFNIRKQIHLTGLPTNYIYKTPQMKFDRGYSQEFIHKLYNLADIYVSAHEGEGFGLPFAESMSAGIPIVATDYTTVPEFVGDDERGMKVKISNWKIDRGVNRPFIDIDHWCDCVEYLLDNPSTRKKMGRNARRFFEKELNHKKLTQQWLDVFNKCTVKRAEIDV